MRASPGARQAPPGSVGQFLDLAVGNAVQLERDQVDQLVRHLDLPLNRLPVGPILRPLHPKFDQTGCQPQKKIVGHVAVLPIPVRLFSSVRLFARTTTWRRGACIAS